MKALRILYFSLIPLAIFTTGCEESEQQEAAILGVWEAEWLNNSGNGIHENDIMHGKMIFRNDYDAEVEVYGYKDCVFFADTVKQALQWQLVGQGDTLQLFNPSSSFTIAYTIKGLPDESLQLKFMEDITIKLKKL